MYFKELQIPEGVSVDVAGNKLKVVGPKGEIQREFQLTKDVKIEKQENKIKVYSESERRKVKALVGTIAGHIGNMFTGVTKGFTYKLKIVFSHFPITVKVDKDKVLIQNFLGERKPRVAKIVGNVQVKVDGADVTVSGIDLDDVGTTASNLEQATRIKGYDKRVFQDGIWIVGRE
jgi:large subunit ribosomal protein L6